MLGTANHGIKEPAPGASALALFSWRIAAHFADTSHIQDYSQCTFTASVTSLMDDMLSGPTIGMKDIIGMSLFET